MVVCIIFLVFAEFVGLPFAILALISLKRRENDLIKYCAMFLSIIAIGLYVGTVVTGGIGLAGVYACQWVSFGLGVGCTVLGLATFFSARVLRNAESAERAERAPKIARPLKTSSSRDYIDEIKALKELLDCGAITQEEYDAKKKEILSR